MLDDLRYRPESEVSLRQLQTDREHPNWPYKIVIVVIALGIRLAVYCGAKAVEIRDLQAQVNPGHG